MYLLIYQNSCYFCPLLPCLLFHFPEFLHFMAPLTCIVPLQQNNTSQTMKVISEFNFTNSYTSTENFYMFLHYIWMSFEYQNRNIHIYYTIDPRVVGYALHTHTHTHTFVDIWNSFYYIIWFLLTLHFLTFLLLCYFE